MTKQLWYVLIITVAVNLMVQCKMGKDMEHIRDSVKRIEQIMEVR